MIWDTIKEAEKRLLKPSTTTNVAFQILGTKLNQLLADEIIDWLIKNKKNIFRLAIIGATIKHKRTLKRSFRKKLDILNYKFIYDWDTAKDWLVGHTI